MDSKDLVNKFKGKIGNIVAILLALIIANNIYKRQVKEIESVKIKSDSEIKKNTIIEDIGRLEEIISVYKNLLPKKDMGSVIDNISNIANETGVKIVSIRPMPEARYPDYMKALINLGVIAPNYHVLGDFISKIESYNDVYMVESADIRLGSNEKELNVNLTVSSVAFIN